MRDPPLRLMQNFLWVPDNPFGISGMTNAFVKCAWCERVEKAVVFHVREGA
jgi:hypothetical protein